MLTHDDEPNTPSVPPSYSFSPNHTPLLLSCIIGLRECARWVMAAELDQKWFYDVVVRLRDDTFAFGPWLLSPPSLYRGGLSSMSMGKPINLFHIY